LILIDSSIWIAHLRGQQTAATAKLAVAVSREPILVGDLDFDAMAAHLGLQTI